MIVGLVLFAMTWYNDLNNCWKYQVNNLTDYNGHIEVHLKEVEIEKRTNFKMVFHVSDTNERV